MYMEKLQSELLALHSKTVRASFGTCANMKRMPADGMVVTQRLFTKAQPAPIHMTMIKNPNTMFMANLLSFFRKKNAYLTLRREKNNPNDPNAIAIIAHPEGTRPGKIGHVPKETAKWLAKYMDRNGCTWTCFLRLWFFDIEFFMRFCLKFC